jgi:hypothetical protein
MKSKLMTAAGVVLAAILSTLSISGIARLSAGAATTDPTWDLSA